MGRRSNRFAIDGFSQLEARIMDMVWQGDRISVREIHEVLVKDDYLPYTTVMATMAGLSKRGVLKQDKSGKTYFYSAKVDRLEIAEAMIEAVLKNVLKNDPDSMRMLGVRFKEHFGGEFKPD